MKTTKIFFHITTVLMTMLFAISGSMMFIMTPPMLQMFHELGLPGYFPILLGACKLGGLVFLWWPKTSMKLWAYHGYAFLMGGAIFSHLAARQSSDHAAGAVIGLSLTVASMVLWHRLSQKTRSADVPNELAS